MSVANEKLRSFLAAFKIPHVCICNRFENTLISYHPNYLYSPVYMYIYVHRKLLISKVGCQYADDSGRAV
jgi:hypothetical protein